MFTVYMCLGLTVTSPMSVSFVHLGVCGPDGLYYRDENSFVLCSNAKGYIQPCAPGTRNAGLADYEPG